MQTQYVELTDNQLKIIEEILKDQRKRKHSSRDVNIGILAILRTGTQWRNLNHSSISWQVIYYYFRKWKDDGTLERLNSELNTQERIRQGKEETPSLLCSERRPIVVSQLNPFHLLIKIGG